MISGWNSLTMFCPVRDKNYVGKSIELVLVTQYAFAEYSDGTFGFWAAGKAGWFELQSPADSFEPTYLKMNEAASVFYMLADRVRRARVKASDLSQKELRKYMNKVFGAVRRTRFLSKLDAVC